MARSEKAHVHFRSARGVATRRRQDGLYWPTAEGETPSPLGELAAVATARGYGSTERGQPFNGYLFKLLKAQGPHAEGGAYGYMAGDSMVGGFAAAAYPAEYGNSGIMTFIVSHDGKV